MKRSDFYIRIMTVVLFLAVASYIGVYIYNATLNTFETSPAIFYTVDENISTYGYIIRTETVLTETGIAILPAVGEGEKVASGQAVAVEYMNREALETASELRALKIRIAQIESSDESAVEAACIDSVMELSAAVQSGDLSSLDELAFKIETNIFAGGPPSKDELPALYARRESLENRVEGLRTIYAPVSGTFSQVIDGFEHVDPSALINLLPTRLEELFKSPSRAGGVGKLVTEFKWFFAAVMDAGDAAYISAGKEILVRFSGAYNESLDMTVVSVGKKEEGKCVVLLTSDRSIHQVASLRRLQADIVTGVISGIRVPKEAVQLDDDARIFVYLQTGARAERVDIEILHEAGDAYLVRDGAETGSPLRAGSTIIVKANGLYDGKIVK